AFARRNAAIPCFASAGQLARVVVADQPRAACLLGAVFTHSEARWSDAAGTSAAARAPTTSRSPRGARRRATIATVTARARRSELIVFCRGHGTVAACPYERRSKERPGEPTQSSHDEALFLG